MCFRLVFLVALFHFVLASPSSENSSLSFEIQEFDESPCGEQSFSWLDFKTVHVDAYRGAKGLYQLHKRISNLNDTISMEQFNKESVDALEEFGKQTVLPILYDKAEVGAVFLELVPGIGKPVAELLRSAIKRPSKDRSCIEDISRRVDKMMQMFMEAIDKITNLITETELWSRYHNDVGKPLNHFRNLAKFAFGPNTTDKDLSDFHDLCDSAGHGIKKLFSDFQYLFEASCQKSDYYTKINKIVGELFDCVHASANQTLSNENQTQIDELQTKILAKMLQTKSQRKSKQLRKEICTHIQSNPAKSVIGALERANAELIRNGLDANIVPCIPKFIHDHYLTENKQKESFAKLIFSHKYEMDKLAILCTESIINSTNVTEHETYYGKLLDTLESASRFSIDTVFQHDRAVVEALRVTHHRYGLETPGRIDLDNQSNIGDQIVSMYAWVLDNIHNKTTLPGKLRTAMFVTADSNKTAICIPTNCYITPVKKTLVVETQLYIFSSSEKKKIQGEI